MSRKIDVFQEELEYYRQSGLSPNGRDVCHKPLPYRAAKNAAISHQRHWISRNASLYGGVGFQSDEFVHSVMGEDDRFLMGAGSRPDAEQLYTFNELVRQLVDRIKDDGDNRKLKMLYLTIRRQDLEHYLDEDLLEESLEVLGEAEAWKDKDVALECGYDLVRGKSHSNQLYRDRLTLQDMVREIN